MAVVNIISWFNRTSPGVSTGGFPLDKINPGTLIQFNDRVASNIAMEVNIHKMIATTIVNVSQQVMMVFCSGYRPIDNVLHKRP
jgi:hypothetical protein